MKAQIEILQELLRRLEETWKLLKIESMKTAEQDWQRKCNSQIFGLIRKRHAR